MYPSTATAILLLVLPLASALTPHTHIRQAPHLQALGARDVYDAEAQRVAKLRATSERAGGSGQVKVRRQKTGCAVANASSTTSSSAAVSEASAPTVVASVNSTGSLMDMLFPMGTGSASWTTCTESSSALSCTSSCFPSRTKNSQN